MTVSLVSQRRGWWRSPFLPVTLIAVGLTARWILIVGYGDFGTDYDYVSRLLAGQWPGRDFYSVFPPSWVPALWGLMWLLDGHYAAVVIHLWLWWAINAAIGAAVYRAAGGNLNGALAVALGIGLLTVPPTTHGASFAFIASALSGVSALAFLKFLNTRLLRWALTVGVFGGICVFVKPNVGLGIALACAAALSARAVWIPAVRSASLKGAACIVIGLVFGAALALLLPGAYGGYVELLSQVFLGGSGIKGGPAQIVLRVVPRVATSLSGSERLFVEGALTGLLAAGSIWAASKLFGPAARHQEGPSLKMYWVLLAGVFALSLWSLRYAQFPHDLTRSFYEMQLVSLPFFLWQVLYVMVFSALAMVCIPKVVVLVKAGSRDREPNTSFWLAIVALAWTIAVVASARHNIIFAATLFLPALGLHVNSQRVPIAWNGFLAALVCWTMAWHIAPNSRTTFGHLRPSPEGSKFSGLYWPDGAAGGPPGSYPIFVSSETIAAINEHLTPRVRGHRVMWLASGPGPAFGGDIYRYGVFAMAPNGLTSEAEPKVAAGMIASPPDYIVASDFEEWTDPRWTFFRQDLIAKWLEREYEVVWEFRESPRPLKLWALKRLVN